MDESGLDNFDAKRFVLPLTVHEAKLQSLLDDLLEFVGKKDPNLFHNFATLALGVGVQDSPYFRSTMQAQHEREMQELNYRAQYQNTNTGSGKFLFKFESPLHGIMIVSAISGGRIEISYPRKFAEYDVMRYEIRRPDSFHGAEIEIELLNRHTRNGEHHITVAGVMVEERSGIPSRAGRGIADYDMRRLIGEM